MERDGWTNGWMERVADGWMNGQIGSVDGWMWSAPRPLSEPPAPSPKDHGSQGKEAWQGGSQSSELAPGVEPEGRAVAGGRG